MNITLFLQNKKLFEKIKIFREKNIFLKRMKNFRTGNLPFLPGTIFTGKFTVDLSKILYFIIVIGK